MSSNTIRARMTLSFRGETYELDSVIDLDGCSGEPGEAPDFHRLLAQAAGIDPYSYLYEVLETHEIAFSDATGVAARHCRDGGFDWAQFGAGPARGTGLGDCQGHRAADVGRARPGCSPGVEGGPAGGVSGGEGGP